MVYTRQSFIIAIIIVVSLVLVGFLYIYGQNGTKKTLPQAHVSVYSDPTGTLGAQEGPAKWIWQPAPALRSGDGWDINMGYTSAAVWVRIELDAAAGYERFLRLGYPLLDEVEAFSFFSGGDSAGYYFVNRAYPFHKRARYSRLFYIPVAAGVDEVRLRVKSKDSLSLPIRLLASYSDVADEFTDLLILGLYHGIILMTILYNLFMYFSLKDENYIYMVGFIFVLHGVFQLAVNGLLVNAVTDLAGLWWSRDIITTVIALGLIFALICCRLFLETARFVPRVDRFIAKILIPLSAVLSVLSFIVDYGIMIQLCAVVGITTAFFILYAGFISIYAGHKAARFYVIGWLVVSVGSFVYAFKIWGILNTSFITEYGLQISMGIESILLSFALTDRYKGIEKEKRTVQVKALEQERLANLSRRELLAYYEQTDQFREQVMALDSFGSFGTVVDVKKTMANLMNKTVASVLKITGAEKAIIFVNYKGRVFVEASPPVPSTLSRRLQKTPEFLQMDIPPKIHLFFNQIRTLGPGFIQAVGKLNELTRDLAPVRGRFKELAVGMQHLFDEDYRLAVPLAYKEQVFGYLVLGRRRAEYSAREKKLLDTFRYSVAMAIHNSFMYDELLTLKGEAEDKAEKLTNYLSGLGEVIRHKISDRTVVYKSRAMHDEFDKAMRYAAQNQPILISGDTGTGKELAARIIHENSPFREAPFIAVNCAAIPASLWESEIFGHMQGAFTDAKKSRAGKVEQAAGGTLFFDEIGEMPLEMQPKLLRLLQERKFQRVGGDKDIQANCRFIFATNRDLDVMQSEGLFRPDLYYRLSVLNMNLPSLGERVDDIPILAEYFCEKYTKEINGEPGILAPATIQVLCAYSWPGNIRELENTVIHAVIHAKSNPIEPSSLPAKVQQGGYADSTADNSLVATTQLPNQSLDELVRNYSKNIILDTLQKTGGDKQEAAKALQVKRATFYYRLKELGIK